MPTQIIGVMSTPPIGCTTFRKGIKNGSVGQAIKLKGKRFRSTCGYQVRMIRNINNNVISPNIGPRIQAVRSTPVIGLSYYLSVKKEKLRQRQAALCSGVARRRHRQKILSFVKPSHDHFNQMLSLPSEIQKQTRSRG